MDLIKSQFDRVQEQLAGLTASQKMLTAALVAIMVMTLVWWGRYAGQAEMEPLLAQSLSDDELSRITAQLDARGIRHEETADKRVLVPADRRVQVIAALSFDDQMPKKTTGGLDEIIKQMTPWDGQDRQTMMYTRGLGIFLGEVIRNFPDVAAATVALDPKSERIIGGGNIEPTAFVSIRMKPGARATKQLVAAAAGVVAGAQAGLLLKNVRVVVDGAMQPVHEPGGDDAAVADLHAQRQKWEADLSRQVVEHFAEMQGVLCSVRVQVDTRKVSRRKHTVNKVDSKELRTTSKSREQSGSAPPPADVGATPNLGGIGANGSAALGAAPVPEQSQSETDEKTENGHYPSWEDEESSTLPGGMAAVAASVRLPRSHFVRIIKSERGAAAGEPDDKAIKERIKADLPQLRDQVVRCINLKDASALAIDPYFDQMPVVTDAPLPPAAASSLTLALGGHVKEIALGALALVSLFMVSTIVKRGTPLPAVAPSITAGVPTPVLVGNEPVAGEVAEGSPLLAGMELDEEAVRSQQILDQVSNMVNQDPDAAAALVKRWLNRV